MLDYTVSYPGMHCVELEQFQFVEEKILQNSRIDKIDLVGLASWNIPYSSFGAMLVSRVRRYGFEPPRNWGL